MKINLNNAKSIYVGIFKNNTTKSIPTTQHTEKLTTQLTSDVVQLTSKISPITDSSLATAIKLDSWGSSNPKFYRIIDSNELAKLLKGQSVKSNRTSYNGEFTDITTNPYYSKIPKVGKFKVEFNNENNSFINSGRITAWAPENSHYHLHGTYNKNDIKNITYFDDVDSEISIGGFKELEKLFGKNYS
ncbi:hypothetical protein HDR58_05320 [bacterium]|nr:hypothetical protein [bacterium]